MVSMVTRPFTVQMLKQIIQRMAFPTVSEALRLYFADRATGIFPVRMLDIVREGGVPGRYVVRRIS